MVHYPFAFNEYITHERLDAEAAAEALIDTLQEIISGEHRVEEWPRERGRHMGAVAARLGKFAKSAGTCSMIWVGHGELDLGGSPWLCVPGERQDQDDAHVGLGPEQLATHLAAQCARRQPGDGQWTIVIIEACGAARLAQLLSSQLDDKIAGFFGLAVIGVGDSDGFGHLGTARSVLEGVLGALTEAEELIWPAFLVEQIRDRLGFRGDVRTLRLPTVPFRRAGVAITSTLDVYARLKPALQNLTPAERSHFSRKGMGADFGELTWSFVGRRAERRRVVEHLSRGEGLLAVTGPAGSGKSAVLGNVLLRARPEIRGILHEAGLLDDPVTDMEQSLRVDGTLHLTGMTHNDVVSAIAEATDVRLPEVDDSAARTARGPHLLDALASRAVASGADAPRLVADALDEARDRQAIATLLRDVGRAGVCVVVGTRASTREGPDQPAPLDRDLLDALGVDDAHTVVVTHDPEALRTFAEQAFARADASGVSVSADVRSLIFEFLGRSGADGQDRQFLFVRLLVAELLAQLSAPDEFRRAEPADLAQGTHRSIFAAAMRRIAFSHPRVATLLVALAYARGRGFPRLSGIWQAAASALSEVPLTPEDLDAAVEVAGAYIMLDSDHERAVYRLAHATFVEHFEHDRADARERDESAIALALLAHATDESELDPYLYDHLAAHVGASGDEGWVALAEDIPLVDRIDPLSIAAEALRTSSTSSLPPIITAVIAGAHLLRGCEPTDRAGVRELCGATIGGLLPLIPPPDAWHVRAASRRRQPPHRVLTGHTRYVGGVVAFPGPDGTPRLATTSDDGTVRIWDPIAGAQVGDPLTGHTDRVSEVVVFPGADGTPRLATTSDDWTVRIWDPIAGAQVGDPLTGHTNSVIGVIVFVGPHDTPTLATASRDGTVRIWDPATGNQIGYPLNGHADSVLAVTAFPGPDGHPRLATTSGDRTVRIWDPITGTQIGDPLTGHTLAVNGVVVFTGPNGTPRLATTSHDGTVRIWDPATCTQVGSPLTGHTGWVNEMVVFAGPDGTARLATTGEDATVRIWDPVANTPVGDPLTGHTDTVTGAAVFPGPHHTPLLATTSRDETVRIWDPTTATQVGDPLTRHTDTVTGAAVFPGTHGIPRLATTSHDETVRIWDPTTGTQIGNPLTGHTDLVNNVVAFPGPHGTTLLPTTSHDSTVRIWDPDTGTQVGYTLTGHTAGVRGVVVFPGPAGATRLATTSDDGTVRIWDPDTGTQLHCLNLHHWVTCIAALDHDLVVGLDDGWARIVLPPLS
ncbi:MAG: AAA family ATPase [Actinomycetales bacterium]